jgi:hypothetical protein
MREAVEVREFLPDGTEFKAVWSLLPPGATGFASAEAGLIGGSDGGMGANGGSVSPGGAVGRLGDSIREGTGTASGALVTRQLSTCDRPVDSDSRHLHAGGDAEP